jgi:hypothetical protein
VKRYETFSELTVPMLNEFVERIIVHERDRKGAIDSSQRVEIHFNFIGEFAPLPELREKVSDMYGEQLALSDKFKPVERRLKTLDEHIRHSENFKKHRGHKALYEKLYAQYKTLKKETGLFSKGKAQKALDAANEYHDTYRAELSMYDAAERYLKDVLQERFDPKKLPPITKWKKERDAKTAEKKVLEQDYKRLKDKIREVEIIRKAAEQIARQIDPPQRARTREMEL